MTAIASAAPRKQPSVISPATPTQITGYSSHVLEQIAGRYGGIGVSQSALNNAWSNPLKIEYVPSKHGPTFRYAGSDAVIVVNTEGKSLHGMG